MSTYSSLDSSFWYTIGDCSAVNTTVDTYEYTTDLCKQSFTIYIHFTQMTQPGLVVMH